MTPPRLRRHHSSTSTSTITKNNENQPLRSLGAGVPRTRSMARIATISSNTTTNNLKTKLAVYDENAIPSTSTKSGIKVEGGGLTRSTTTKNLRSRGPLRESKSNHNLNMNFKVGGEVLGAGDGKGKRKIIEDDHGDGNIKKMMKVDRPLQRSINTGGGLKRERITSIRSIGHQSSSESLRSLEPTIPSTPITKITMSSSNPHTHTQSQTRLVPTPAREILRKNDNPNPSTTSPTTSPPSHIIARPPTPPRMKDRSNLPPSNLPPMTPKISISSVNDEMEIDRSPFKMLASARSTPGLPPVPPSINTNQIPSTPSRAHTMMENTFSLALPSTTPKSGITPRKVFTFPRQTTINSTTTPTVPPPSTLFRTSNTSATPTKRTIFPSPKSIRRSPAENARNGTQPTLEGFFRRQDTPVKVEVGTEVLPAQQTSRLKPQAEFQPALQPSTNPNAKSTVHIEPSAELKENSSAATTQNVLSISPSEVESVPMDLDDKAAPLPESSLAPAANSPPKVASISHVLTKSTSTRTLGNMGPPSRIPISRLSNAPSSSISVKKADNAPRQKPPTGLGSLPERRPSSRPALIPANPTAPALADKEQPTTSTSPIKRKPSYPSSLGSGPLSRPTQRMVSNPIVQPRSSSNPSPTPSDDTPNAFTQTPRAVSAPMGRASLSASTSTREGLSGDVSRSLAGLSDALSKLKAKRSETTGSTTTSSASSRAATNMTTPKISVTQYGNGSSRTLSERPSNLTSSTTTSRIVHRSRSSTIHPGDLSTSSDESTEGNNHVGDQSIAALLCSTNGAKCLNGVRAFVDVRTSDGEDSGKLFIDILKGLGARVFAKPTEKCTHIIYKSGRQSTLSWYRKHLQEQEERYHDDDDEDVEMGDNATENENGNHSSKVKQPFIVGIKWVMECKKSGKKLDELPFVVDISEEDVFQKRRKSMEPKSLAASQGIGLGQPSVMRQAMLDVAQARKRSLMYAPKVSSPLKKGYMRTGDE